LLARLGWWQDAAGRPACRQDQRRQAGAGIGAIARLFAEAPAVM